jgi:hypothetical protein
VSDFIFRYEMDSFSLRQKHSGIHDSVDEMRDVLIFFYPSLFVILLSVHFRGMLYHIMQGDLSDLGYPTVRLWSNFLDECPSVVCVLLFPGF